jgi:hypothetical protein
MTDTTLHGYGRLDWAAARALLDGCACTWTDFDGIHLANTPPERLPVAATHLWGWSADRLVRLRFDTGAVYTAVLGGTPGPGAVVTEHVTPVVRPVAPRPAADTRSGALLPAAQGRKWQLTEIPGESPVTFVRALP